jgi:hypothetical protein
MQEEARSPKLRQSFLQERAAWGVSTGEKGAVQESTNAESPLGRVMLAATLMKSCATMFVIFMPMRSCAVRSTWSARMPFCAFSACEAKCAVAFNASEAWSSTA